MNVWDVLFPQKCILCGSVLPQDQSGVCGRCRRELPVISEPRCLHCGKPLASVEEEYCMDCARRESHFVQGVALWEYTGSMKRVMAEYKYGGCETDAVFFAEELAGQYGNLIRSWHADAIVPVPLHYRKRWFRGYNQAESLALAIGERLGIPVCTDVLRRNRYTEPQKNLDDRQRFANLREAFTARRGAEDRLAGWSAVLLVDDIYTTGATMEACAGVLQKLGMENIYFACLCAGRDF